MTPGGRGGSSGLGHLEGGVLHGGRHLPHRCLLVEGLRVGVGVGVGVGIGLRLGLGLGCLLVEVCAD